MIVGVVVNYRRPCDTLASLQSLLASEGVELRAILVDQAPIDGEAHRALHAFVRATPDVQLIEIADNIGFAGGCNVAIERALSMPAVDAVFLLNNDAFVAPDCVSRLARAVDADSGRMMVAAAMYKYDDPAMVDSLGIVLYGCGLAANRMDASLPLLGPCGGAALYDARLLRDVRATFGEIFDATFFCYAEDTDLALRARALGYRANYVDSARVLHKGSMTSGGADSDTVMYFGLRNSFLTLIQAMPSGFFLRYFHKIILLLACIVLKYARQRRLNLLWRVLRDVVRALPRAFAKRRERVRAGLLKWSRVSDGIDSNFYEGEYLRSQLAALSPFRRRPSA